MGNCGYCSQDGLSRSHKNKRATHVGTQFFEFLGPMPEPITSSFETQGWVVDNSETFLLLFGPLDSTAREPKIVFQIYTISNLKMLTEGEVKDDLECFPFISFHNRLYFLPNGQSIFHRFDLDTQKLDRSPLIPHMFSSSLESFKVDHKAKSAHIIFRDKSGSFFEGMYELETNEMLFERAYTIPHLRLGVRMPKELQAYIICVEEYIKTKIFFSDEHSTCLAMTINRVIVPKMIDINQGETYLAYPSQNKETLILFDIESGEEKTMELNKRISALKFTRSTKVQAIIDDGSVVEIDTEKLEAIEILGKVGVPFVPSSIFCTDDASARLFFDQNRLVFRLAGKSMSVLVHPGEVKLVEMLDLSTLLIVTKYMVGYIDMQFQRITNFCFFNKIRAVGTSNSRVVLSFVFNHGFSPKDFLGIWSVQERRLLLEFQITCGDDQRAIRRRKESIPWVEDVARIGEFSTKLAQAKVRNQIKTIDGDQVDATFALSENLFMFVQNSKLFVFNLEFKEEFLCFPIENNIKQIEFDPGSGFAILLSAEKNTLISIDTLNEKIANFSYQPDVKSDCIYIAKVEKESKLCIFELQNSLQTLSVIALPSGGILSRTQFGFPCIGCRFLSTTAVVLTDYREKRIISEKAGDEAGFFLEMRVFDLVSFRFWKATGLLPQDFTCFTLCLQEKTLVFSTSNKMCLLKFEKPNLA